MNLLERDGQLRQLEAALERAGQGRGTTVLVSATSAGAGNEPSSATEGAR